MIEKSQAQKVVRLLWQDKGEPMAMGCHDCPDLHDCGGTRVAAGIFDCLSHCTCRDRKKCPHVCPNNLSYVRRVQEVRGFGLDDIGKGKAVPLRELPVFAHLLYTYPKVAHAIQLLNAAIPLSAVFDKVGHGAVALTRTDIERKFRLARGTPLILSGVEQDWKIEKYWGVQRGRTELMAAISALNPLIVTIPNFSVFIDTPRHDAMHSLKRIALSWKEFHDAGIRTAFHLNAVTDRDYQRLGDFLHYHTEIRAVSVEFETGAALYGQAEYHIEQLDRLMQRVGRTVHLMYRGDTRWLPALHRSFPQMTLINGTAAVRTRKRRTASLVDAQLLWEKIGTPIGEPLDSLLAHNLDVTGQWLLARTQAIGITNYSPRLKRVAESLEVRPKTHDQPDQISLL